jgi:hypothetical protein
VADKKTTITKSEYLQLQGLGALAQRHIVMQKQIEREIEGIVDGDHGGNVSDCLWGYDGPPDIDDLLKRIEFTVEDPDAA